MKYLLFKFIYKLLWIKSRQSEKRRKKNEVIPENITKFEDSFNLEPYKDLAKAKKIKFNIYYLKEENTRPTILYIHGGGWNFGDKDSSNAFCYSITNMGFNVISLSYTLTFKAKLDNELYEINQLIDYLYQNKDKYKLDFNKFYICGDSAGGELTYLYSCLTISKKLQNIYKMGDLSFHKVNAICTIHGTPYIKDLGLVDEKRKFIKDFSFYGMRRMLLGKNYEQNPEFYASDPDDIFKLLKEEDSINSFPKLIILTSTGDTSFSFHSHKLKEDMDKYNLPYEFYNLEGEKYVHIFNVKYPLSDEGFDFNLKMTNFFKKY